MEKTLVIKGTEDSPAIVFDPTSGEFSIKGRSLPEDASEFYKSAYDWLSSFIQQGNVVAELKISLDYFNSSSLKQILMLMMLLEDSVQQGKNTRIKWCYTADDELMEIKGREMMSMVDVPFDIVIC